jgi:tRNA/rRNA methyltransferase
MRAATIAGFYRTYRLQRRVPPSEAMKTRFILINTSHAGNVGATARAMKPMGFDDLVLVAPRWANVLRREETIQRASGALDVLDKCRIVDTLDEALDGLTHLCATAMVPRDFGPPTTTPRVHFETLSKQELRAQSARGLEGDLALNFPQQGIGFLFGCERFGMRNEDVYRCHVALSIPSNPAFASLNIGAAVQVIAYEWRLALGGFVDGAGGVTGVAGATGQGAGAVPTAALADAQQVAGMLDHLEQSLVALGFLDPAAPKKLMPRLNSLFNRAGVTQEEIHILRGIAKAILQQASAANEAALRKDNLPPGRPLSSTR